MSLVHTTIGKLWRPSPLKRKPKSNVVTTSRYAHTPVTQHETRSLCRPSVQGGRCLNVEVTRTTSGRTPEGKHIMGQETVQTKDGRVTATSPRLGPSICHPLARKGYFCGLKVETFSQRGKTKPERTHEKKSGS